MAFIRAILYTLVYIYHVHYPCSALRLLCQIILRAIKNDLHHSLHTPPAPLHHPFHPRRLQRTNSLPIHPRRQYSRSHTNSNHRRNRTHTNNAVVLPRPPRNRQQRPGTRKHDFHPANTVSHRLRLVRVLWLLRVHALSFGLLV